MGFLLAVLIIWLIYKEDKSNREAMEFWERWESNSFLFNGGRYDKDVFEIKDGRVVFKEGKQ